MEIRMPAFSGQFYPKDKCELQSLVLNFLKKANPIKTSPPSIIIIPHAGYIYSGQTAAFGFSQLTKDKKKQLKIILLGVSHQNYFPNIAIDDSDYWQTPLGKVKVNKALIEKLFTKEIIKNSNAHLNEHTLEVQLPFLQTILKDFSIIPILIGQANIVALEKLADKIAANLDKETILIISSDLSHYPDEKTAEIVDTKTIAAIKSGNPELFPRELKNLANQYPQIDTFACGADAIYVGMLVGEKIKADKITVYYQTNSGEISRDRDRVVGYASLGFYSKRAKTPRCNTEG